MKRRKKLHVQSDATGSSRTSSSNLRAVYKKVGAKGRRRR
jgi:hypothetical protein